jgi:hypothetical protein
MLSVMMLTIILQCHDA